MTRVTFTLIALLSALAAPVAVNATSRAGAVAEPASPAAIRAEEPSCQRRIRIVYAGYGEAGVAACAVLGATARN